MGVAGYACGEHHLECNIEKMATAIKQDMPPKGGYPGITYTKNVPKRGPSGLVIMLGGVAAMAVGFYGIKHTNKKRRYFNTIIITHIQLVTF